MTWLAILGLGAWVFILAMRVGDLKRDLQAMQARLREQAAPRPQTGLLANPIGAWWRPAVAGPPILDSLLVGFLGPAVLRAAATLPRVAVRRMLLLAYAAGAGASSRAAISTPASTLSGGRSPPPTP